MTTLKTFLAHRGSLTAAAQHLGVMPSTVLKWSRGDWTPGGAAKHRIDTMLATVFFNPAKKRIERLPAQFSEVKPSKKTRTKKISEKSSCVKSGRV